MFYNFSFDNPQNQIDVYTLKLYVCIFVHVCAFILRALYTLTRMLENFIFYLFLHIRLRRVSSVRKCQNFGQAQRVALNKLIFYIVRSIHTYNTKGESERLSHIFYGQTQTHPVEHSNKHTVWFCVCAVESHVICSHCIHTNVCLYTTYILYIYRKII